MLAAGNYQLVRAHLELHKPFLLTRWKHSPPHKISTVCPAVQVASWGVVEARLAESRPR